MPFHATVKGGSIDFGSPAVASQFQDWKRTHDGERIVISAEKPAVSDEMRGYMFGAVIPFLRRLVPDWAKLSDEQVYEVLKKNFHYFEAYNPVTKRKERYGQSVMSKSSKSEEAMQFVQEIGQWVAENYAMQLPDPEKYKKWRDSAPMQRESFNGI